MFIINIVHLHIDPPPPPIQCRAHRASLETFTYLKPFRYIYTNFPQAVMADDLSLLLLEVSSFC